MNIRDGSFVVTGGAGQVGSRVANRLLREGARRVVVFDDLSLDSANNISDIMNDPRLELSNGDVMDYGAVAEAIAGSDCVFHLAALMTLHSRHDPRSLILVNIDGTYNVLDACRKNGVRKMVFSSSRSVYGVPLTKPITENHPLNHRSIYGATKVAGEHLCQAFNGLCGLDYVTLRYSTVYGPPQHKRGRNSIFLMENIERIAKGLPPVLKGKGDRVLNMIFAEDAANANILAAEKEISSESFLIASESNTTELEVIRLLSELFQSHIEPRFEPDERPPEDQYFDVSKAAGLLGFKARTPLRDGLLELIQWWRNVSNGRKSSESQ